MRQRHVVLFATGALLSSGCPASPGKGEAAATGSGGPAALSSGSSQAAAVPVPDTAPPAWLPPGYTELAWSEATALIRSRATDRVIGTQTRRAYLVTRTGDKHYIIEPRRGDLKALIAEVEADADPLMYREFDEIPWREVEAHFRDKRVSSVTVGHFKMVMVSLKGGGYFLAIAPADFDVKRAQKENGGFGLSIE